MQSSKRVSEISKKWFDQVLKLKNGEELHIPVADKKVQKVILQEFLILKKRYNIVSAEKAQSLSFTGTFHDGACWVKATCKKIYKNAILVHKNGAKEKVHL